MIMKSMVEIVNKYVYLCKTMATFPALRRAWSAGACDCAWVDDRPRAVTKAAITCLYGIAPTLVAKVAAKQQLPIYTTSCCLRYTLFIDYIF